VAKLTRANVVTAALDLLDEVGIDAMSTRRLAQRLGVEQPALYWHFKNKAALLNAMADAAMSPHAAADLPVPSEDWAEWFTENTRSFRRTLLARRDGARLHGGSLPADTDRVRIAHKIAFLVGAGFGEADASAALLAAGRFTVGSVLEEQANPAQLDHDAAFDAGLRLIVDGLAARRAVG
jgi:TetR/AcrR family transcriptional regulator, tetracycline repressor protein